MKEPASLSSTLDRRVIDRRGAARVADVPPAIRKLLSLGQLESKNLCEMLAIDVGLLFRTVVDELPVSARAKERLIKEFEPYRKSKVMSHLTAAARILGEIQDSLPNAGILAHLGKHRSDTVRSWAAFIAGSQSFGRPTRNTFLALKPYAADSHMGVRECAWMALRPHVAANFERALPHLLRWAKDKDFRVRRCAIEATRPRGVWCSHFELMKSQPECARPLLELVNSDPERYVQNSVANWLNDAGKSKPEWVRKICRSWSRESKTKETAYIVRRAMRNLDAE